MWYYIIKRIFDRKIGNFMGNIFKILPTPPYRKENIKKAEEKDLFLFDSRYICTNGSFSYVYGVANKVIALPFTARIINDLDGKIYNKNVSYCYDINGHVLDYILPDQLSILCIEDLEKNTILYGFTAFDNKEYDKSLR